MVARAAAAASAAALLVAAAACNASGNPGPPWLVVHRGRGAVASLDTTSIVSRGSAAEVWLRFDHSEPQAMPSRPGTTFDRVDVRARIECATQRVEDLWLLVRNGDDPPITAQEKPTRWGTFREHPFGEYVLPAVCERLPGLRKHGGHR